MTDMQAPPLWYWQQVTRTQHRPDLEFCRAWTLELPHTNILREPADTPRLSVVVRDNCHPHGAYRKLHTELLTSSDSMGYR